MNYENILGTDSGKIGFEKTERNMKVISDYFDWNTLSIEHVQSGTHTLSDYRRMGIYYFKYGVTMTDCPSGTNGWLMVLPTFGDIAIKQIWYRHGTPTTNDSETYVRLLDIKGNRLGEWTKYFTKNDVINPNMLINGDFQVWQDGFPKTLAAGTNYSADMWRVWHNNSSGITFSRTGQYATPVGHSGYSLRMISSGETNRCTLVNIMDMAYRAGKPFTLSFDAFCNGVCKCDGTIFQGTSDTTNVGGSKTVTLEAATWTRVVITGQAAISSDQLGVKIGFSSVPANSNVYITNVKLEYGSIDTMFASKSFAEEFIDCVRYYHVGYLPQTPTAMDTGQLVAHVNTPVPMRIAPTFKALTAIYAHEAGTATTTYDIRPINWTKTVGESIGGTYAVWLLNGASDPVPSGVGAGSILVLNSSNATSNRLSGAVKYSLDARYF